MKSPFLLLAAFAALPAFAGDDFGLWSEASVQKDFSKKFSVQTGFEFRSKENVTEAARYGLSAGVTYKAFNFLHFGVGYAYLRDHSSAELKSDYKEDKEGNPKLDEDGEYIFNGYNLDHGFWRNKHRFMFDVTGKVAFGRFGLSVRERYQYTHYKEATTTRDRYRSPLPENMNPDMWSGDLYPCNGMNFTELRSAENVKEAKDRHYLRSRFKLEYNIRKCHWTPYVSYEFTNNFGEQMDLEKTRLAVGSEWKITKQHRLDFAYLYENGCDADNDDNRHVLSISYKFKF